MIEKAKGRMGFTMKSLPEGKFWMVTIFLGTQEPLTPFSSSFLL